MVAQRPPNVAMRLVVLVLAVGILSALVTIFVVGFMLHRPPMLNASANSNGQGVKIHLEVVGSVNSAIEFPRPTDPHPTWVSYLPTTILKVPANSMVTMQIDQEDTPSGLRNPFWGQAQGIVGGTFHMAYFDNSGNPQQGDFTALDDPANAAHTFAIPDLGVFVPLEGVNAAAPAGSMNVITFSFMTGKAGTYHWQCFVPCGSGTIYGNGGPMQTTGYMAGFLIVQ
ncbi:MAG TPA: hypothetical protein VND96_02900 [Candidatus Micrarchaeaceae archaeon]|nr:hypothetical protein [Candidatus Micrarchaeaceae archaeon]